MLGYTCHGFLETVLYFSLLLEYYKDLICHCEDNNVQLKWAYNVSSQKFKIDISRLPRFLKAVEVVIKNNASFESEETLRVSFFMNPQFL